MQADDTEDQFLNRMKIAEVIWNYCIANEFGLSVFDKLHQTIALQNDKSPEMKEIFNLFVEMKNENFSDYKNFIIKVEVRTNKAGNSLREVNPFKPS